MPKFRYKARNSDDQIITGLLDCLTLDEAADKLGERELIPVDISEEKPGQQKESGSFFEKLNEGLIKLQTRVPFKDVVFFTRQLATMVAGGVPVARALNQLAKSEKPVFRKIINQVSDDISMGSTFSESIGKHPGAFSPMFVSVVHSGEVAGALDRTLDELATYMENMEAMRSKVKGAMRYPVFIFGFVTLLVVGIMWKLVPVFENMYASMGAELPGPTKVLLFISNLISSYLLLLIAGMIAAFFLFKFGMTKEGFKYQVHKYILKIPIFGEILKKNIWASFSRTMALLMECGIPILQATEIVSDVVANKFFAKHLRDVYENLKRGDLLSISLEKTAVFSVLISQLVMTGEQSGSVDALLRKAADFYEREIRVTVDSIASIIEPLLIIVLGGAVGSILIALYMPIFQIGKILGH